MDPWTTHGQDGQRPAICCSALNGITSTATSRSATASETRNESESETYAGRGCRRLARDEERVGYDAEAGEPQYADDDERVAADGRRYDRRHRPVSLSSGHDIGLEAVLVLIARLSLCRTARDHFL